MTLKHRLEGQSRGLLWWEQALFWTCWILLDGLGLWLGLRLLTTLTQ